MLLKWELSILSPRPICRALRAARIVGLTGALSLMTGLGAPTAAAQQQEVPPPPPLPPIDARSSVNESSESAAVQAEAAPEVPGSASTAPPPNVRRAADDGEDVPIPPKVLDERARVEPTVEIRRDEEDNIIEEYMLEGRVYMVKVTPKTGVPYYYMDTNGDGQLELSEKARSRGEGPVRPVYWKIKEW